MKNWIELPIGKKLDSSIDAARKRAKAEGKMVLLIDPKRVRPMVEISSRGDVNEVHPPTLRVKFGEFVVEQVLAEGHIDGPAARLLQVHNRILEEKKPLRRAA